MIVAWSAQQKFYFFLRLISEIVFNMIDFSSKSLGLWAGLGTAAFLGYCIYFDRKRRSHPDFRRKLREKRKAANKSRGDNDGPALPDFSDQEAVQRFFLQEVRIVIFTNITTSSSGSTWRGAAGNW